MLFPTYFFRYILKKAIKIWVNRKKEAITTTTTTGSESQGQKCN